MPPRPGLDTLSLDVQMAPSPFQGAQRPETRIFCDGTGIVPWHSLGFHLGNLSF